MTFADLSVYFQRLEHTNSRLEMTDILSDLFVSAGVNEIGIICYLLLGRVAPRYEPIEFGFANKFMIRSIALATNSHIQEVQRVFAEVGDLGDTYAQLCRVSKDSSVDVSAVYESLYSMATMSGEGSQEKKIEHFAQLLRSLNSTSGKYAVRIPLSKLRLGFSDMTMIDALSWMISGDKSLRVSIERAYNVRSDIGYIARVVKEKGVEGLRAVSMEIGTPVIVCLCQRLKTADEMIEKMGTVAVEPKYDGTRVQIHFRRSKNNHTESKVISYSRNLENTTHMFPELSHIGESLVADRVILDSEAVGMDVVSGDIIPFQMTITRKRKHGIDDAMKKVPLKFFIYDILF